MKIGKNVNFTFKNGFEVVNQQAPRTGNLITKVVSQQLFRDSANIGTWRDALDESERVHNPSRVSMTRVYNEVVLDAHLSAQINMRTSKVLSHKFHMVNDDLEVNDDATELMNKAWFNKVLQLFMEAKFWGYNLIQFNDLENFGFESVEAFPKENIEPNTKVLRLQRNVIDGIPFDAEPFNNWVFFIEDDDNKGLLNKAAPMAIWKKDALGSWGDFSIMFGIPARLGKTDVRDKELRANMEGMLKNWGKMLWGVFDKDDTVELVESSTTDAYNVFLKLIETTDAQMSKLIVGQTMSADNGSSKSQGEVHERMFEGIIKSDISWLEMWVNSHFIPWLIDNHSFPLEGVKIKFDQTESLRLSDQTELIKELLPFYTIPEDWINEKFGIPVEVKTVEEKEETTVENLIIDIPSDVFLRTVNDFYGEIGVLNQEPKSILTEEEQDELFLGIYNGTIDVENLSPELYEAIHTQLNTGVTAGFGGGLNDFREGSEKHTTLRALRNNIYSFSAAKTYQYVKAASVERFDSKGKVVELKEFRKQAQKLYNIFNKHHQKTEFNTSIAQSQGADDWLRINEQKDTFPLLVYRTMADSRVRDEHADLDGITRKVDDSFWAMNFPPNGYNCRCETEQEDSGAVTPLNQAVEMFEQEEIPPVFRMNSGLDKIVFKANHPYFRVPKKDKDLKRDNFGLPIPRE